MLASSPAHVKHISHRRQSLLACFFHQRYSRPDMIKWSVEKSEENLPLIGYLQRKIAPAPPAYLRQLIRGKKVLCNGSVVVGEQILQIGDEISVAESKRLLELLSEEQQQPKLLFESDEIMIVHKPSGLAIHSSERHEQDNLVDRVKVKMAAAGKKFKIAAIHRLDLPTSGPVIFGKGQKAISALGTMMQENQIRKKYLALVRAGLPANGLLSTHVASKGKVKHAETRYHTLEQNSELALLELELETGRQHQIRKQLATKKHPVVGDTRYRGLTLQGLERMFLHCHFLEFTDPFTSQTIIINDTLPTTLADFLVTIGFAFPKKAEKQP